MTGRERTICIMISLAVRRTGISPRTVRRYVRRGLVGDVLTEADLAELRRIRRLMGLGSTWLG